MPHVAARAITMPISSEGVIAGGNVSAIGPAAPSWQLPDGLTPVVAIETRDLKLAIENLGASRRAHLVCRERFPARRK
jgi:hypothetical protein